MSIKYKLGLTHQFNCNQCGHPLREKSDGGMLRWVCTKCSWESECLHAPNIMKVQHRIILLFRYAIFALKSFRLT